MAVLPARPPHPASSPTAHPPPTCQPFPGFSNLEGVSLASERSIYTLGAGLYNGAWVGAAEGRGALQVGCRWGRHLPALRLPPLPRLRQAAAPPSPPPSTAPTHAPAGLSVPAYFEGYTQANGHGPVNTGSSVFNNICNVIFQVRPSCMCEG